MAAQSQLIPVEDDSACNLPSGFSQPVALPGRVSSSALETMLRKVFSFPVLLGSVLVAGAFSTARLNVDPDTWWHVAIGRQILATGHWPVSESYSFTAHGDAWIAYEWLGEVLMAFAANLGGLAGLAALLVVLAGTLIVLLYYYCLLYSKNSKASFIACAAVLPLAVVSQTLRPQILGYIFLLATLICLERFRQGHPRALWFVPGIFVFWVNTHGGYVFGLFALAVYWASGLTSWRQGGLKLRRWTTKERRQLLLTGLLSAAALAVTPYGTRLAAFPLQVAVLLPFNKDNVNEWLSMPFDLLPGKLFLGFIVLFLFTLVAFRPSFRSEQIALLVFAVYAASFHRRFLLFFVLIFAPILSSVLARWIPPYDAAGDHPVLNAALILLVTAGLLWSFPSGQQLEDVVAKNFPQQSVEYLRRHPAPGPLLNQYDWGGYLMWSLGPNQKIFIDGRTDIYEYAGVFPDYMRIANLDRNSLPLLRRYGIQAVLMAHDSPLGTLLASLPDWKQAHGDSVSTLFFHVSSEERNMQAVSGGNHAR